jgi:capsular polysaccharide export protein
MGHSFYLSKVFNNTKENNDNLDLKKFDNLVFWGIRGFNRFKLVKDFHKKVLIAEDGFIRSILTPADKMVSENKIVDKFYLGHSVIFDDLAPHFVAKYQTRIEQKLNSNFMLSESELARSRKCIKKIVENNITKYNFQDLEIKNLPGNNDKKVLIIDQTAVDASIKYSNLLPSTYTQILQDAISENPNSDIIIKIHPDSLLSSNSALAGFYNEENTKFKNVYLYSEIVNPISLIKKVDKVYVGSSGVGMEAILCGKKVFCYGAPFYAGWGLTEDRNALFVGEFFKERRSKIRTTEEVFYIFYIWYTNYVNSKNKESCELEEIIDLIIDYRREFWNTL